MISIRDWIYKEYDERETPSNEDVLLLVLPGAFAVISFFVLMFGWSGPNHLSQTPPTWLFQVFGWNMGGFIFGLGYTRIIPLKNRKVITSILAWVLFPYTTYIAVVSLLFMLIVTAIEYTWKVVVFTVSVIIGLGLMILAALPTVTWLWHLFRR